MFYDKKIKYVDVYENGERVQNAGFVRLEAKEDKVKIQVQVSGMRATDTMNCPVVLLGEEKEAVLGELQLERGKGAVEFEGLAKEDLAGGIGYDALEEIQIRPAGNRLVRCVVREHAWKPEPRATEVKLPEVEKVAEPSLWEESVAGDFAEPWEDREEQQAAFMGTEVAASQMKSEVELLQEAFLAEKRMRTGEDTQNLVQESERSAPEPDDPKPQRTRVPQPQPMDKWQQLLAIYPHIRPFEDRREYLLMKPQDFVVLAEKYFSLSENSFLLHGFYNYDHLIMSKERRPEGERIYIGVPGNFYDKEKRVAIMFGFESFEGKREPARIGDFGYYMIPVEI